MIKNHFFACELLLPVRRFFYIYSKKKNVKKKIKKEIDTTGTHSFVICVAIEVGERKAILLKNIKYWCDFNKANNHKESFIDGHWWTYNSSEAYVALFPYWNRRSISRWLNELVADEWLLEANHSSNIWDRAKWHSVTRKYNECILKAAQETLKSPIGQNDQSTLDKMTNAIGQNDQCRLDKMTNAIGQNDQSPITYIKPYIKQDVQHTSEENDSEELHEERKLESSFDVKDEILNQKIFTDSPENRVKVWLIFQEWIKHESFLSLWGFYSDRFPEVDSYELMKVWVQKADWHVVTNVKVNLISGWIETANQKIKKLKLTNGKSRNNKNLISSEDAKTVFADLIKNGI